jgi:Ca-activated chloride channel family protein
MTRPELSPSAPLSGGMLLPRDEALPPVPLEHTEISVDVAGPLAETAVVQRFRSAHTAALDALYVFPLPADAAVGELELRVGGRVIRGEVRPRAEAEARFRDAAERGHAAALLGQERPNLFSVELANLQPGEVAEVRLRFFERVPYDDGWFTLTIPTVVLPRYTPEGQPSGPRDGVVPLLPEGEPGHTLAVRVAVDVGRLAEIASPSHEVDIAEERGRSVVTLRDPAAVPDRDLVLRYRPVGDGYAAAAFVQRVEGRPGALLLMLTPRAVPAPDEVLPREVLFVFDRSGSMGGASIAQARNALRSCLRALNPGDSFNIFPFDNYVERLAPAPLPFTQAAVDAADSFIAGIDARGGTEIVGALREALAQPRDPGRLRVIVFLTDGAVGNEAQVLRELAGGLNEARVFAFGVGSAVNRFLLDKLAEVGRGAVEYILPGEPIEPAVQRFQQRAALPLVQDLAVEWGGAHVADALPAPLPDLYAGQPLVLLARYHGLSDERALVTIRGRTARGTFAETLVVDFPAATPDRGGVWAALPRLWARARLVALEDEARLDPARAAAREDEARQLALEHGLLSAHTSFVAVEEPPPGEERRRAEARVVVPVHLPAGTRREAFQPAFPPAAGVHYAVAAMAAPSPAPRGALQRRTGPGMAARFLDSLRSNLAGESADEALAAPQMRASGPAALSPAALPAAPAGRPATPAERREAALRFLARTQGVDGSWAGDEQATALAALAFARAGHTARAGAYRPQLGRAANWLATRAGTGSLAAHAVAALAGAPVEGGAAEDGASAALRGAALTLEQLTAAQRLGGDADGAALPAGADPLHPDAHTLALTAALAILV